MHSVDSFLSRSRKLQSAYTQIKFSPPVAISPAGALTPSKMVQARRGRAAFVAGIASSRVVGTRLSHRNRACAASRRGVTRSTTTMRVYNVDIALYGKQYTIPVDENQTFLEGIEEFGLEVPYSCRAGVCITCAAKVVSGDVDLGEAAITDDLKQEGYVLTCSGFPLSEGIKLEMNQFEDAYDKQYGQYEEGGGAKK